MARGERSDEDMNVSRSRIPDLEPERLLQELQDGGVQYVLIGGFATPLTSARVTASSMSSSIPLPPTVIPT